ncbi:hypothetical protein J3B00_001295 [Pseudomonas sp. BP8]|nr:hypothetical protein [Pseudomonas sp. BP8]
MPLSKITPAQTPPVTSRLQETSTRPPEVAVDQEQDQDQQPGQRGGRRIAALSLCLFTSGFVVWLAGLRPAICVASTGLFAGQARSYRYCAEFKNCADPVGAGLPREEARITTTHVTIKNNASPDAARNFATSGGRVEVLRREVEAMDGRKALRPRMGRTARSSRSKTGAREPVAQRRAGCRSRRFLVTFFQEKK